MILRAWRLSRLVWNLTGWRYCLAPWRSPLVRWRLETYGLADEQGRRLDADDVTAPVFFRFLARHRRTLVRFFRWAANL